jgi:hypothetical protein
MEKNEDYPDIFVIMPETDDDFMGWYFNDENMNTHGPFSTYEETVELYNIYIGA